MPPLSRDDLEALSAYIDGALSPQERAALESRLAADPTLRTALEELRHTVRILRAAPRLAVPRNYTLDPARFARRAPWWSRLDIFRTMGMLGAAASTALIVLGVLLGQSAVFPTGAPQTSQSDQTALQASRTDDKVDTGQGGAAPTDAATRPGVIAALPTQAASPAPPGTSTPPAPQPSALGQDVGPTTRQADNEAAQGQVAPSSEFAPGALPPSPAEPLTQPTLTALADFAADSFEAGAGAESPRTTPAAGLLGEGGPLLAAQATATSTALPTSAPTTAPGRLEQTSPVAPPEQAAAPPLQPTAASTTVPATATLPATSVAVAPLPTEAPSPAADLQPTGAVVDLPRLFIVVGMSLLVLSVVAMLIGLARRSRS